MTDKLSFNDIPEALSELNRKIDILLSQSQDKKPDDQDKLLTLTELVEYLPEHPAKQTVYGWVNDRLIPFEKHGKKLYFRKSVIDLWLSNGRQK
jgi:hypothetical protein